MSRKMKMISQYDLNFSILNVLFDRIDRIYRIHRIILVFITFLIKVMKHNPTFSRKRIKGRAH